MSGKVLSYIDSHGAERTWWESSTAGQGQMMEGIVASQDAFIDVRIKWSSSAPAELRTVKTLRIKEDSSEEEESGVREEKSNVMRLHDEKVRDVESALNVLGDSVFIYRGGRRRQSQMRRVARRHVAL